MAKANLKKRSKVLKVGINDSATSIVIKVDGKKRICPYYIRWANLLQRCYGHGARATMSEEWLHFSVFKKWMEQFDWKGQFLVSTVNSIGCTHFSKENCIFVPKEIKSVVSPPGRSTPLPVGVHDSVLSKINPYKCIFKFNGQIHYMGSYSTTQEAHSVYVHAHLDTIANLRPTLITPQMRKMMINTIHPDFVRPEY